MTVVARQVAVPAVASAVTALGVWRSRHSRLWRLRQWERTNHRGAAISLVEGPAWAAGAVAGVLAAAGLDPRTRAAAVLVTAGAATFGAIDDHAETGTAKGLKGHLGALRNGQVTTGAVKIAGIGAVSLLAAALATPGRGRPRTRWGGDVAVSGLLIAAGANMANLLDLRPGRVLKTGLLAAPAALSCGPAAPLSAAATGAGLALLPADLAEQGMLGDCGANALGALLTLDLVTGTRDHRRGALVRGGALAALAALTLASEKVSFTQVIENTPVLRELDAWGRIPRVAPA